MTSLVPGEVLGAMIGCAERAPRATMVEVGVYQGGSAVRLAQVATAKQVRLYLFDTFAGMPVAGGYDRHRLGDFADTSVLAVQKLVPTAIIHSGIFPDTLPDDCRDLGFVHCDVDQYDSTRDVIRYLWPRLVTGGVMWFDDPELEGALKAIHEYCPVPRQQGPQGRLWAIKP